MERSRLGPYLRVIVSVLPTVASSTSQPEMKPSAWRISAMCDFSLEYGMETSSWCAELAFRTRVSMSAIGSVMVMGSACPLSSRFPPGLRADLRCRSDGSGQWCVYQLDLVTPGSSPRWAISRRHTRHSPNLRYTDCGRPHRWHRV